MCKILVVGDMHIKYIAPKFRKDTFYNELLCKIDQINKIAEDNNATVIVLGDLFNSYVEDYFENIMFDISSRIKGWYSLIGNHDCKSVDGNLRGTSFGALVKAGILNVLSGADVFHYYNRENFTGKSNGKIAFIHDYILPKGTKEKFKYKECSENDYDIVFCGHYHYPMDIKIGKTRYVNPGSLMRLTISEIELNRNPEVILFDTKDNSLQHIKLDVQKIDDIIVNDNINKIDEKFNSKFVDMLVENNLINNNKSDIIQLLKNNNIDISIINYISKKLESL